MVFTVRINGFRAFTKVTVQLYFGAFYFKNNNTTRRLIIVMLNLCGNKYWPFLVFNWNIFPTVSTKWNILIWSRFKWNSLDEGLLSYMLTRSQQGSHIYWKTWKDIVHLERSWNFAKNNKNHGNIMEFCQSGNVGTLGYCGNDIFLIRWNFYVSIDPKVIGGHFINIQKIYMEFFEKPGKIMEFCQSENVGTLSQESSRLP